MLFLFSVRVVLSIDHVVTLLMSKVLDSPRRTHNHTMNHLRLIHPRSQLLIDILKNHYYFKFTDFQEVIEQSKNPKYLVYIAERAVVSLIEIFNGWLKLMSATEFSYSLADYQNLFPDILEYLYTLKHHPQSIFSIQSSIQLRVFCEQIKHYELFLLKQNLCILSLLNQSKKSPVNCREVPEAHLSPVKYKTEYTNLSPIINEFDLLAIWTPGNIINTEIAKLESEYLIHVLIRLLQEPHANINDQHLQIYLMVLGVYEMRASLCTVPNIMYLINRVILIDVPVILRRLQNRFLFAASIHLTSIITSDVSSSSSLEILADIRHSLNHMRFLFPSKQNNEWDKYRLKVVNSIQKINKDTCPYILSLIQILLINSSGFVYDRDLQDIPLFESDDILPNRPVWNKEFKESLTGLLSQGRKELSPVIKYLERDELVKAQEIIGRIFKDLKWSKETREYYDLIETVHFNLIVVLQV
jgi:hypothetical protein